MKLSWNSQLATKSEYFFLSLLLLLLHKGIGPCMCNNQFSIIIMSLFCHRIRQTPLHSSCMHCTYRCLLNILAQRNSLEWNWSKCQYVRKLILTIILEIRCKKCAILHFCLFPCIIWNTSYLIGFNPVVRAFRMTLLFHLEHHWSSQMFA